MNAMVISKIVQWRIVERNKSRKRDISKEHDKQKVPMNRWQARRSGRTAMYLSWLMHFLEMAVWEFCYGHAFLEHHVYMIEQRPDVRKLERHLIASTENSNMSALSSVLCKCLIWGMSSRLRIRTFSEGKVFVMRPDRACLPRKRAISFCDRV